MKAEPPLLAIVIPTRNRQRYVTSALKSLTQMSSPDIEIVIEDNSDTNELFTWIQNNAADPRITYNYSNIPTSQTGNYDRSMRGVTAEFVAFIGDDDAVNPEIVNSAAWAKQRGYDAIVPLNKAHFFWPDFKKALNGTMATGELHVSPFTGQISLVDPETELKKCLLDAGQNFHSLPRAYYGIIRRHLMEQVKEKTGTYFPGVSPDLAAAVALANVARNVCMLDYPLFLPGSSRGSNAGISGLKKHVGALREQSHLDANCERNWSAIVPPFFSVQTIWAETTVASLTAMKREDLLPDFNVPKLYAWLLMFYPQFLRLTQKSLWPALKKTNRGALEGFLALLLSFLGLGCLRAKYLLARLKRRTPDPKSFKQQDISDIEDAVLALQKYLKTHGWSFSRTGVSYERIN